MCIGDDLFILVLGAVSVTLSYCLCFQYKVWHSPIRAHHFDTTGKQPPSVSSVSTLSPVSSSTTSEKQSLAHTLGTCTYVVGIMCFNWQAGASQPSR